MISLEELEGGGGISLDALDSESSISLDKLDATYGGALGESFKSLPRSMAAGALTSVGAFLENPPDEAEELASGFKTGGPLGLLSRIPETVASSIRRFYADPAVEQVGRDMQGAGIELAADVRGDIRAETPEDLNYVQKLSLGVIPSVAMNVPALAAARFASPAAGAAIARGTLGTFGAQAALQESGEARLMGATPDEAFQASILHGVSEIATEKAGLDALMKGGKDWLKQYLLRDVVGEDINLVTQSLSSKGLYDPEKWSSPQEIFSDFVDTTISAAVGAGITGATAKAIGLHKLEQTEQQRADEELVKTLQEKVQEEMLKAQMGAIGLGEEDAVNGVDNDSLAGPNTSDLPPPSVEGLALERTAEKLLELPVDETTAEVAKDFAEALEQSDLETGIPFREGPPADDVQDTGDISPSYAARRAALSVERTLNPQEPFELLPIISSDARIDGLTLSHIGQISKGVVAWVGGDDELAVKKSSVKAVREWVREFMPEARIIIDGRGLDWKNNPDTYGASRYIKGSKAGDGTFVLNIRDLASYKYNGGNQNARMVFASVMAHEFGHALEQKRVLEGLMEKGLDFPAAHQVIQKLYSAKVTAEDLGQISQIDPVLGDLVARWAELRAKVLDGTMTAREFTETWTSPRKVGYGFTRQRPQEQHLYQWTQDRLAKRGLKLDGATAFDLLGPVPTKDKLEFSEREVRQSVESFLSFREFMAEQFARHAYSKDVGEEGPLGRIMGRVLQSLRDFFRSVKTSKGDPFVFAADQTFQDWLAAQSKRTLDLNIRTGRQIIRGDLEKMRAEILAKEREKAKEEVEKILGRPPEKEDFGPEEELDIDPEEQEVRQMAAEAGVPFPPVLPAEKRRPSKKAEERRKQDGMRTHKPTKDEDTLDDLLHSFVDQGLLKATSAEYRLILSKLEDGLIGEAEWLLRDLAERNQVAWDREYTTSLVKKLGDRTEIAANELRAILNKGTKRADIQSLGEVPLSGMLSVPELVKKIKSGIAPLVYERTQMYSDIGPAALGGGRDLENSTTLLWRVPTEGGFLNLGEDRHFPGMNDILAHTRILNRADSYELLEIQSGFFQRKMNSLQEGADDPRVQAMKNAWGQRLVQEVLYYAWGRGKASIRFPSDFAVEVIEGWPRSWITPEGEFFYWRHNGRVGKPRADGSIQDLGELPGLIQEFRAEYGPPKLSPRFAASLKLYQELRGWAEKFYGEGAQYVTDSEGYEWLEISTDKAAEQIVAWDAESPSAVRGAQAVFDSVAGVSSEAEIQTALAQWKALRFNSPYFKKWFGASALRNEFGEPRRYWRGAGALSSPSGIWWLSDGHAAAAYARKTEGPILQQAYLKVENPLVKEAHDQPVGQEVLEQWIEEARQNGFDGVWVKNLRAPFLTEAIFPLQPDSAALAADKDLSEVGLLGWDQDSQTADGVRRLGKKLQGLMDRGMWRGNWWAVKAVEKLIQLQQLAVGRTHVVPLQAFYDETRRFERFKSQMQERGEELVKFLQGDLGFLKRQFKLSGVDSAVMSKKRVELLRGVLKAEWEEGAYLGNLQERTDADGLKFWEIVPSIRLAQEMKKQGIVDGSEDARAVLEGYVKYHEAFQRHWDALQKSFEEVILKGHTGQNTKLLKIAQLRNMMDELRGSPFFPQSRFGQHVVIIEKDQGVVRPGQRRFIPVNVIHFESAAEARQAEVHWRQKAKGDPSIQVRTKELKENAGFTLQLPREFLELVKDSGYFELEQIKILEELMTPSKTDKALQRYRTRNGKLEGASEDLIRSLSDFFWHDSNGIAKLRFRARFNEKTRAMASLIRQTEKGRAVQLGHEVLPDGTLREKFTAEPAEMVKELENLRRDQAVMLRVREDLLSPKNEWQAARLWITLAHLAWVPKTALMNFSSQFHTYAAMSSEYGEVEGTKGWMSALGKTLAIPTLDARLKAAKDPKEVGELSRLRALIDKATSDGVIDQSFAYFLAGQANGGAWQRDIGKFGSAPRLFFEMGMWPFRMVEKANRISSLIAFFDAEYSQLRKEGKGADVASRDAYNLAVQKTNLLQNSFQQANKPWLFTGKKSIFFIFGSYTQHMLWIFSGGYERAAKKQMRLLGRVPPNSIHGTTMKLWLIWLMLAGASGAPGADNLMDLIQWVWRKMFGHLDIRKEMRAFIKDYLGMDPYLGMHGLLGNVAGFDLSGSFGFGRPVPGTQLLGRENLSVEQALGRGLLAFSGPAGGFYSDIAKFINAGAGGQGWVKATRELPGLIGNLSKAIDVALLDRQQGTALSNGARLQYDIKAGVYRDLTTPEILGIAMGANPEILARNREALFAGQQEKVYWQTRRKHLMDLYRLADREGDAERKREMVQEHLKFNNEAPKEYKIDGGDRARSLRRMKDTQRDKERDVRELMEKGY